MKNCFVLEGSKNLIFRREEDEYMVFDSLDLEFYKINESGTCILFLISEKLCYDEIIGILQEWFSLDRQNTEEYVQEFISVLPFRAIFLVNLVELGFPVKCLF